MQLARVTTFKGNKAHLADNARTTLCGRYITGFDFGRRSLCGECRMTAEQQEPATAAWHGSQQQEAE